MSVFPDDITLSVSQLLQTCREQKFRLTAVESCTGGLLAACLTSLAGSSDVFDRAFVTYSNQSKMDLVGVHEKTLTDHGAVSPRAALEMAKGALQSSQADIAISITGIAGPGGFSDTKPLGLVYMAVLTRAGKTSEHEFRFGALPREDIRLNSVRAALELLARAAAI